MIQTNAVRRVQGRGLLKATATQLRLGYQKRRKTLELGSFLQFREDR